MMSTLAVSSIEYESLVWALLAVAAGIALVAILSPRFFSKLNAWSSVWIDVDRFAGRTNKRIDIDHRVLLHSRLFGAMTIVAAGVLAGFSMKLQDAHQWIVLPSLGLVVVSGLVALFSPRLFSRLARWGSLWVDVDKSVDKMNYRIEIDRHVLRHCRLFGAVVLGAVVVLATALIWST
jgi:hypothetical protein